LKKNENNDEDSSDDEKDDKMLNNLNCHTGARFADYTECEKAIMLIDIIIDKFKFIHPLDSNPNNIVKERFTTCKELYN